MGYKRRLSAIMFTDIQGYTRLMQESESRGVDTRAQHRSIFDPTTVQYNGTIIQYYGDGTLSIFDSCVDAVKCAIEMQLAYLRDPSIPVRIGIHVGDILLGEKDIIGDSVNLAARVESLGVSGSVLISDKVYEEIKNKEGFPVKSLGQFHFKNDAKPRTIYALTNEGLVIPRPFEMKGKLEKPQKRPWFKKALPLAFSTLGLVLLGILGFISLLSSGQKIDRVAVLPFENRIEIDDQEYLADGMHEELIIKLAQTGLKVRPYTTMKQYVGTTKTARQIAQELNVDALVEGSVYKIGNEFKIRVQLISGTNDEYLMKPFESQTRLANIQFLYRDLVRTLVDKIEIALTPEAVQKLNAAESVDPQAYDLYLQGRHYLNRGSIDDIYRAIDYYHRVLELDPNYGQAYSGLVESYLLQGFGLLNSQEAYAQFRIYLQKAIELDENFANDHHQLAMIKIFSEWDWSGAAEELRLAIQENPESWEPYDSYAQLMWAIGRMDESIAAAEKSVEVDPDAHFARCDLAWAYYFDKQIDRAKEELKTLFKQHDSDCPFHTLLDFHIRIEEAQKTGTGSQEILLDLEKRRLKFPKDDAHIDRIEAYANALYGDRVYALELARSLEKEENFGTAAIHLALGDKEEALNMLNQSASQRAFYLMYTIKMIPNLNPLRAEPEFQKILKRLNLDRTDTIQLKPIL